MPMTALGGGGAMTENGAGGGGGVSAYAFTRILSGNCNVVRFSAYMWPCCELRSIAATLRMVVPVCPCAIMQLPD